MSTARKLPGYDPSAFPRFAVTVDVVVFRVVAATLEVLLVRRAGPPYAGRWAIPGGFKRPNETLEAAAQRELEEETNVQSTSSLSQLKAYGDPGRDPRMEVVTVAFFAVANVSSAPRGGSDASEAQFHPARTVLTGRLKLAFDHRQIVTDAVEQLRRNLEISNLATKFVGSRFTLSELRAVYEAIWETRLDAANFRRNLLSPVGWVKPTGKLSASASVGGKPAEYYKAGTAWRDAAPLRRSMGRASQPDRNGT